MPWLNIVAGAVLLLCGRRLFWVFVAGVGFVVSATLATRLLGDQSPMLILGIAVAVGFIGALVSLFVERLVVRLAGALAGGYVGYTLAANLNAGPYVWVALAGGALLGVLLAATLLDWALILLSSLFGATVVAQNLPLVPAAEPWVFVVLIALGVSVQTRQWMRKGAARDRE